MSRESETADGTNRILPGKGKRGRPRSIWTGRERIRRSGSIADGQRKNREWD
jgi:hypothetical protein